MERHVQALKEINYQLRLVCPTKLSFQIEGEMKNLPQELKEFMTTKPEL
jgi:hypothetical protein